LDGHVFCVEDGQVEVVSVASWHVVARFSGDFVDHTATQTHWVGLGSALGRLYVDHRNLQGRLLGEPVQLPIDSEDGVGLVTDKERVFVGSRDGRIFKVELGKCSEIASVKNEGLRLKSLSVVKSGLLALFAGEQDDQLRRFGFDGKALRQTELGFVSSVDHPVVMGDRAYLVDSAAGKLVAVGLKKGEVLGTVPLPFGYVRQFSGFCNGDRHSLLLIAGQDEGSAKVWLVDAESGDLSMVCEANQKHVEAMLADGRVVVSSSNSYQNSLRVFDPFGLESQRRAA
jgi:outer membrane protein assembly factor BamB